MADSMNLAKAQLQELDADFNETTSKENWTTVQFNPETLKVTYSNQVVVPNGTGDQTGPSSMQFVGAGVMKLSLQLWFDCSNALRPISERSIISRSAATKCKRGCWRRWGY